MKKILVRLLAVVSLTCVYGITLIISKLGKKITKAAPKRFNRIIINGTFHNPNWFFAHIEPITKSEYGEVILVTDAKIADLPNLRTVCPPNWAMKCFTRAGAKAIWTFAMGIKYPCDCFMGYHIFPSAATALICARLLGTTASYQVTSGPLELEGGGWHAENQLLVALQYDSPIIEKLALAVTRSFDLVIVRGESAKQYIVNAGFTNTIEVVTGSVLTDSSLMQTNRDIDVIFVGRLTEYKRPDRFLHVIALVVKKIPNCNVAIVGDGPDKNDLKIQAEQLGISNNIRFLGQRKDVPELQGRSKIFVLTSRWEGVSIAMLEAMGLANVPVVSDVGDLRDFAIDDTTGYVLNEEDTEGFADRIVRLLEDSNLHSRLSSNSRELILRRAERSVVAKRWHTILSNLHKP